MKEPSLGYLENLLSVVSVDVFPDNPTLRIDLENTPSFELGDEQATLGRQIVLAADYR